MTPEQRYRLELAKDRTPSTNLFVWLVPIFLCACWICRNTDAGDVAIRTLATMQVEHHESVYHTDYSKYANNDPLCGDKAICVLGWGF